MKKVLCTGSSGFIFSNFVRKATFEKSDYNLVSIDACKEPNALNNIYMNRGHVFHIGNITDRQFIDVIFELERPDIVIHGAAESFVDSAIKDASNFVQSNVAGTQILLDASVKWGVEKFIYISTDEVYGQLSSESEISWKEDASLAPRNPYAATKAAGEFLVKAANVTHGLRYNITRSCNNYGPRQQIRNFIPKSIVSILKNEKMPIYGKGTQLREWIHVEDNCKAILKILKDGVDNETYNISSGHEFSNIEVFHEICNILGRGNELIQFVNDRPGHDFRYSVDSSKLRNIGWKPDNKFKNGLYNTVSWYEKNPWFWR